MFTLNSSAGNTSGPPYEMSGISGTIAYDGGGGSTPITN